MNSKKLKPEEIIEFLQNFADLKANKMSGKSRLVRIRIPETLFKALELAYLIVDNLENWEASLSMIFS